MVNSLDVIGIERLFFPNMFVLLIGVHKSIPTSTVEERMTGSDCIRLIL